MPILKHLVHSFIISDIEMILKEKVILKEK